MLCCPVEVEAFATGWSLVQRSPPVCLNKITKPQCVWGGQGPYKDCRAIDDDKGLRLATLLLLRGTTTDPKTPRFLRHLVEVILS
jgi:hypothetical protein